jgi:hypothetical protein
MKIEIEELIDVVDKLNEKIENVNTENYVTPFSFIYATYFYGIKYNEEFIWSSEDDERKYMDELDEYEDLYTFCIKEVLKICELNKKIYKLLKSEEES